MFGNSGTRIIASEALNRPSVVPPRQDDVDLVTAVGAVFVLPDHPGLGVDDETQRIAMPQGVDFRPIARAVHEWVVGRYGAIVVEAQDLAAQAHGILRDVLNVVQGPAANGHVDHAVPSEDDAAVETRVALVRIGGDDKVLDVDERVALEPAPRECRNAHAVSDRLGVGEIDQAILGKLGMEGNIHETPVAVGPDLGHAGDVPRVEHSVSNDAQAAVPLGDQHAAAGQERDGPWMLEPVGLRR